MNNGLPGDPGLPPGVTDNQTESRSMSGRMAHDCHVCGGNGYIAPGIECDWCDGTGDEPE